MSESKEIINTSNVLIVGKKRSGKTVEAFKIARAKSAANDIPIFTYRHPNDVLIGEMLGEQYAGNISSILELKRVSDCVVVIDEAHIFFNPMEKKVNAHLRDILGLSSQRGVSIIFVTHSFQFMNQTLMASYIDVVLIKQLNEDHWETDRRYAQKAYGSVFVQERDEVYVHLIHIGVKRYVKSLLPAWWQTEYSEAFKRRATSDLDFLFSE